MPNHVHVIVVIDGPHAYSPEPTDDAPGLTAKPRASSLGNVIGGYKAGVTRACQLAGISDFRWQERFYDHIIRTNASVNAVRDYIEHNPQNWLDDPDRMTI